MANSNSPRGFDPVQNGDGSPWNQQTNTYYLPASDTAAYYIGDTVTAAAGGDANGVQQVVKILAGAEATSRILGVVVGVAVAEHNPNSLQGTTLALEITSAPAIKTQAYYLYVVDDQSVIFQIQDDGAAALTATSCNKNASYSVVTPANGYNLSATVLGTASVATTNTLPLRIRGLVQRADNAFGVFAKWRVSINNHFYAGGTAGV